jgi:hypothetical protein
MLPVHGEGPVPPAAEIQRTRRWSLSRKKEMPHLGHGRNEGLFGVRTNLLL